MISEQETDTKEDYHLAFDIKMVAELKSNCK